MRVGHRVERRPHRRVGGERRRQIVRHGDRARCVVAADLDRDGVTRVDAAGARPHVLAEPDTVAAVAHRHRRPAEGHPVDRAGDRDARPSTHRRRHVGRNDDPGQVARVGAEHGLEPVHAHPRMITRGGRRPRRRRRARSQTRATPARRDRSGRERDGVVVLLLGDGERDEEGDHGDEHREGRHRQVRAQAGRREPPDDEHGERRDRDRRDVVAVELEHREQRRHEQPRR